jgi:hypothetical protein
VSSRILLDTTNHNTVAKNQRNRTAHIISILDEALNLCQEHEYGMSTSCRDRPSTVGLVRQ